MLRRRERTIEDILDDIDRLSKLYAIQEFNPIVYHLKKAHTTDSKDPSSI